MTRARAVLRDLIGLQLGETDNVDQSRQEKHRRADRADEVAEMVAASAALAFDSQIPVAVLLSQRLIGAKVFVK